MSSSKLQEVRFKCQQSGHCCCDPKIIVTTTFLDMYNLYQALENDFDYLLKKISFYRIESDVNLVSRKKLVLSSIQTSEGEIIPSLRKVKASNCVFYTKPNCSIYQYRPQACKNYPITYLDSKSKNQIIWAKNSQKTCPGIGKGKPLSLNRLIQEKKTTLEVIKTHNDLIHELNTEAAKGEPLTAREVLWMFIVYAEKFSSPKEG
ncbi:MAG: YkgJ family cysteine cluster protein [Candidatus Hodarchaeales archaeon]